MASQEMLEIQPETIPTEDLVEVTRAVWRELKVEFPNDEKKLVFESILNELTFRCEHTQESVEAYSSGDIGNGAQKTRRGTTSSGHAVQPVKSGSGRYSGSQR